MGKATTAKARRQGRRIPHRQPTKEVAPIGTHLSENNPFFEKTLILENNHLMG